MTLAGMRLVSLWHPVAITLPCAGSLISGGDSRIISSLVQQGVAPALRQMLQADNEVSQSRAAAKVCRVCSRIRGLPAFHCASKDSPRTSHARVTLQLQTLR